MSTVSFRDHVELLAHWQHRRRDIVAAIENRLLNVQGKELARARDRRRFERILDGCFFGLPGLPSSLASLHGQLAASHLADGFEPVPLDRFAHQLDPLELVVRAYEHWDRHRWPGSSGRLTFAQTIYMVFVLRQIEGLSLRLWDDGIGGAGDRRCELQVLLDGLNTPGTPHASVRDVRWLMQTAQGPLTRRLEPYFRIADRVSSSFTEADRLVIHGAGAKLAGGHLRSQLRYAVWTSGKPSDDPEVLAFTRNSNSMDNALLVRDLVALLDAYETACHAGDPESRLDLADAILQGLSADPELLLTRLDLLAPYIMVEELFLESGDNGEPRYSSMGEAHCRLLERYGDLIGRLAAPLHEDALTFDPSGGVYSPYGIVYGFITDVLFNMAAGTLLAQHPLGLTLEDMFVSRGRRDDKLAKAMDWAALPTREGEREHFEHSAEWAGRMFARLVDALRLRAQHPREPNASTVPSGRLFIVAESHTSIAGDVLPPGVVSAQEYRLSSDASRISSGTSPSAANQIVEDRQEARFLASAEPDGEWFAISKIVLSVLTAEGKDTLIRDVPRPVVERLKLTCPGLVVFPLELESTIDA